MTTSWLGKSFYYAVGLVAALLCMATLLFVKNGERNRSQTYRHPNGITTATLEWYDFHKAPRDQSWHPTLLHTLLHKDGQNITFNSIFPDEPTLSVFSSFRQLKIGLHVDKTCVIHDELGNSFSLGPMGHRPTSPNPRIFADSFSMFPRRGKELTLQILSSSPDDYATGNHTLAKFTIPNPAAGEYPQWPSSKLPVKGKTKDLEVNLIEFRSLHEALEGKESGKHSTYPNQPRTELTFQIKSSEFSAENWLPGLIEVWDATGNHALHHRHYFHPKYEMENICTSIPGALWPGENAWKLKVEFIPQIITEDSETIVFSEIPIPKKKEILKLDKELLQSGHPIKLIAVVGTDASKQRTEQGLFVNVSKESDCITVLVQNDGMPKGQRLRFHRATDSIGNNLPVHGLTGGPQNPQRTRYEPHSFNLKPSPNATTFQLELKVTPSRFMEFKVSPDHETLVATTETR